MVAHASFKVLRPVLALGAIVIHMLNAVIYRPAEKTGDVELELNCCAHRPSVFGDASYPAPAPLRAERGLYFISDLLFEHDIYRLPITRSLTALQLARIYRVDNWNALQAVMFTRSIAAQKRQEQGLRPRPSRLRRPRMTALVQRPEDMPAVVHDFGLAELEVQLEQHAALQGPDIDQHPDGPDAAEGAVQEAPDARISEIWNQLFVDIFQVSPNRRGAQSPAYCTLTSEEIQTVTPAMFQQSVLPFTDVQLKRVNEATWDETFFDRFFPRQPITAAGSSVPAQHFACCSYYQLWQALRVQIDDATADTVRRQLLVQWQGLHWLPYSGSDRMWATRRFASGYSLRLPLGSTGAAPQIAMNHRAPYADLQSFSLAAPFEPQVD